jgi:hypothetical protein
MLRALSPPCSPGDELCAKVHSDLVVIPDDARCVKALLLYADRVTVIGSPLADALSGRGFMLPLWMAAQGTLRDRQTPTPEFWAELEAMSTDAQRVDAIGRLWPDKRAEAISLFQAIRAVDEFNRAGARDLVRTVGELARSTPGFAPILDELLAGETTWEHNPFDQLYGYWIDWALTTASVIPVGAIPADSQGATIRTTEGALAGSVLGELELFPDSELDVLLDVRQRLTGPRIRLRAALRAAAEELGHVDERQLADAVLTIRRRVVDPSLAEVREGLEELDARPTLVRMTTNKTFGAALATTVAFAIAGTHGPVDVGAMIEALIGAGSAAVMATEISFRRTHRRQLSATPFWALHEAARYRAR